MSLFALISYVVLMSITPGPNNILLTTSGVNFGIRRTLPMSFGISVGSSVQCFIALSTFYIIFSWMESLRLPLAFLGCGYLLWLSWRLYRTTTVDTNTDKKQPMTFMQMALFQWVNPKAWLMAMNVAVLFGAHVSGWQQHVVITVVNGLSVLPCALAWTLLGDRLKLILHQPKHLQWFNLTMALLMALTAFWLLFDEIYYLL